MQEKNSAGNPWVKAARPRTLPAAVIPVLVGSGLAASVDSFTWLPALICMVFALLVQIGTNFANDYYDWKQGADDERRIGPTRAVASGLIEPDRMKLMAILTLALAFFIGLSLICWGGWWLLAVGIASVVSAVAYTAQPIALGYRGLGDIFVILFFGFVAVGFTTFVQAGYFPAAVWPSGLAIGLLANNLLVINNYRDCELDAAAGKRTLIVRFGPRLGESLVLGSLVVSLLLCFGFAFIEGNLFALSAVLGLIPIFRAWRQMPKTRGKEGFSKLLQQSAQGLFVFGILLTIGLFFG